MRWGALAPLLIIALTATTTSARKNFDYQLYLPGTVSQLDKSRQAFDEGNLDLALAHSKLVLHDEPMQVFVDYGMAGNRDRNRMSKAVDKALKFWNDTLGFEALTRTEDSYAARVQVVFTPEVDFQGVPVGGYCSQSRGITPESNGQYRPDYSATIYARTKYGGRSFNEDCLVNIVAHEIGHIYGLSDCADPGHLMSGLNPSRPKFELQADELEALQSLRLTALEIQRSIESREKGN
jgi:hypothetical protein